MRMVYNVIDQIIPHIPKQGYTSMKEQLQNVKEDSMYKAPEQMPEMFARVADILERHLGEPDVAWQIQVQKIFAGKEK